MATDELQRRPTPEPDEIDFFDEAWGNDEWLARHNVLLPGTVETAEQTMPTTTDAAGGTSQATFNDSTQLVEDPNPQPGQATSEAEGHLVDVPVDHGPLEQLAGADFDEMIRDYIDPRLTAGLPPLAPDAVPAWCMPQHAQATQIPVSQQEVVAHGPYYDFPLPFALPTWPMTGEGADAGFSPTAMAGHAFLNKYNPLPFQGQGRNPESTSAYPLLPDFNQTSMQEAQFNVTAAAAEPLQLATGSTAPVSQPLGHGIPELNDIDMTDESSSQDSQPLDRLYQDKFGEHPEFPSSRTPIPPYTTLEQICWNYPNHLKGTNLRPFLAEGWSGQKIWDHMQEASKAGGPSISPSRKISRRLQREANRIRAEIAEMADAANNPGGSPESESRVEDDSEESSDMSDEEMSNSEGRNRRFPSLLAFPLDPDFAERRRGKIPQEDHELYYGFRREFSKQAGILRRVLHTTHGQRWLRMTKRRRQGEVRTAWLVAARTFEKGYARENGIDLKDMRFDDKNPPFDNISERGMLNRMGKIVRQIVLRDDMAGNDQTLGQLDTFDKTVRDIVLKRQLAVLKDRTGAMGESALNTARKRSLLRLSDESGDPTQDSDQTWLERSDERKDRGQIVPERAPADNRGDTDVSSPLSSVPPSSLDTTESPGGNDDDYGRMFPGSPSRDVPLSEEDLANLNNILDRFPEHLAIPTVMLRFCRRYRAKSGGYPIKDMVDRLRRHPNVHDGQNLGAARRDRALERWIIRHRGLATQARRRGHITSPV